MPRRGPELTPQMRSRICELKSIGYSYTHIHRIHPEIPLGTIRSTVRLEAQRKDNLSKARSGAPRKLSEEQRDQIWEITEADPHTKIRDLLAEVDHAVKKRSIQYLLREMDKRKWAQLCRPEIQPHHAQQRLNWAQRYQYLDWNRVKWSDECTVERGHGIRPIWTFTRPRDQLRERDVKTLRTGKSVKKMFWAGFGSNLRSQLVPLDGDPESARGGVSSRTIFRLYSLWLPSLLRPGDIFMHDNAPVHTAYIIRDLLHDLGVNVMDWPPYSPDLNPIENLWALMKAKIYEMYPHLEHAADTEDTLEELIEAAAEAWEQIDFSMLQHLNNTMPHRVQAVIEAGGWYTKY